MGKPSKDFFNAALNEMNLEAEQAIMVGDDIGERFFFLNFKALFYYYYFIYILYVFVSYIIYLLKCVFAKAVLHFKCISDF